MRYQMKWKLIIFFLHLFTYVLQTFRSQKRWGISNQIWKKENWGKETSNLLKIIDENYHCFYKSLSVHC